MTDANLKAYLKDIVILENILYTYQSIEKAYLKKIQKLNEEKNTIYLKEGEDFSKRKFHFSNQVVPSPDVKPHYLGEKTGKRGNTTFIYGFRVINDMFRKIPERWFIGELSDLKQRKLNKQKSLIVLTWIVAILLSIVLLWKTRNLIPAIVFCIIALFLSYQIGKQTTKNYIAGDPFYEEFMKIYAQKYNEELKKKEASLAPIIHNTITEYEKNVRKYMDFTRTLLDKLYAKKIIHPKYQNFIAVSQLYDYLHIGRCTGLEGADGAYNLYEQEKQEGLLISDLDMSLFKIEKYESSMYTLVHLLKQNEPIISKIISEINQNTTQTIAQINVQYENQYLEILHRY